MLMARNVPLRTCDCKRFIAFRALLPITTYNGVLAPRGLPLGILPANVSTGFGC
jgi:hypothetical protein